MNAPARPAAHADASGPLGAWIRAGSGGAVGLACAFLAGWLALHHPLSPALALTGCAVLASAVLLVPASMLLGLLTLLPLAGLAPWTGWLVVEEFDLLVLALAAGGWLRMAGGWPADPAGPAWPNRLWPALLWLMPLAVSTALSMERGVADAGGWAGGWAGVWSQGWWQGYREPLNSLRLAKPLAELCLLLPLLCASWRADAPSASRRLSQAMTGLLLVVSLAVLWERLAYTGLLDFSSDYRVTGPFWEMHVGGAALDAVLAMALPFAFASLFRAETPARWLLAASVLGLALYAALVTFSRIVYAAVPLGLLVLVVLQRLAPRGSGSLPPVARESSGIGWQPAWVGLPVFMGLAVACFPTSGYRGLLALLGAVAIVLPAAGAWRVMTVGQVRLGLALVPPGVLLVAAIALVMPKGAYVGYLAAWLMGASAVALASRRAVNASWTASVSVAAYAALLAGAVTVAVNWGGPAAAPGMAAAALVLGGLGLWAGRRPQPLWPASLRWQAQALGCLVAAAAAVGVFGGGAYMAKRMSDSSQEAGSRREHWRLSLDLVRGDSVWLGLGLGRFTSAHALSGRPGDRIGDYRLAPGGDPSGKGTALVMSSGDHILGFGEVLRVSQRVPTPAPGPLRLQLQVLATGSGQLQFEVCEKHLLYPGRCLSSAVDVPGKPDWQRLDLLLKGDAIDGGAWYAPRLAVFSVSVASHKTRLVVDQLVLTDSGGRELLANGDFESGLARWFFSSDRFHMPWHAKSMPLHLLVEQGVLGLASFGLAFAGALWRTSFGAARGHPMAPPLAGALVGLLVVGLIDSILDMPRVAFLTLLIVALSLILPRSDSGRG